MSSGIAGNIARLGAMLQAVQYAPAQLAAGATAGAVTVKTDGSLVRPDGTTVSVDGGTGGTGGVSWGQISGDILLQIDLKLKLDAKAGTTQVGGAALTIKGAITDGNLVPIIAPYGFTLTDVYMLAATGSTAIQLKKNGANLGSLQAVTTTVSHQTISSGNVVSQGDLLLPVASGTSGGSDVSITFVFVRTMAQ